MKTQWVVESQAKKTRWGWTSYFKTEKQARNVYEIRSKDKCFSAVRIYKETWKVA